MKNIRLVAISVVLIAIILILSLHHKPSTPISKCGPYRTDKVITLGSAKLSAETAATKTEQAKGLSGRPCIEATQAMLFDFGKAGQWPMWMKDMKFPIDIVWVSTNQKIVGMEREVSPNTYPDSFANKDKPARYVIEVKSGLTKQLNLDLGQSVKF
jgi:uncharacterized protein